MLEGKKSADGSWHVATTSLLVGLERILSRDYDYVIIWVSIKFGIKPL